VSAARRLIVNADDFGLSEGVTEGILQAMRDGIVTSTSVLATAPGLETAVRRLASTGCRSIGIHLNLTSGRPLGPVSPRLLAADGSFRGPATVWSLGMLGRLERADVEAELRRQLEAVEALGVELSHIDGHHHVHVLPQVAPVVAALARAHRIPAVRWPRARPLRGSPPARLKWRLISHYAAAARSDFAAAGLATADRFLVWYARGRHTRDDLLAAVARLPAGLTELAVHPGLPDDALAAVDRYVAARPLELAALCDASVRRRLHEQGVVLTSFVRLGVGRGVGVGADAAGRADAAREQRG